MLIVLTNSTPHVAALALQALRTALTHDHTAASLINQSLMLKMSYHPCGKDTVKLERLAGTSMPETRKITENYQHSYVSLTGTYVHTVHTYIMRIHSSFKALC